MMPIDRRVLMIGLGAAGLSLAACAKAQTSPGPYARNKAFLDANAKAAGVHVTASGLQYRITRSGPPEGNHPKATDDVKVNYEGKLLDGTVFDSSYARGEPAVMPLADLVPGWIEALQLMRPGDEWTLWIPPELGYGENANDSIPAASILIFRLELLSVG